MSNKKQTAKNVQRTEFVKRSIECTKGNISVEEFDSFVSKCKYKLTEKDKFAVKVVHAIRSEDPKNEVVKLIKDLTGHDIREMLEMARQQSHED